MIPVVYLALVFVALAIQILLMRYDGKRKAEIVICSAVRLRDGRVFRGHRHGDCLIVAETAIEWNKGIDPGPHHMEKARAAWLEETDGNTEFMEQGFITSRNRFVNRRVAYYLQTDAGIKSVAPGGYRGTELYSEDLY